MAFVSGSAGTTDLEEGTLLSRSTFEPCHMFFYGSLMDPDVLASIMGLCEPPVLEPATISGFRMKMWGPYPTLIPVADDDDDRSTNTSAAIATSTSATTTLNAIAKQRTHAPGMIWKLDKPPPQQQHAKPQPPTTTATTTTTITTKKMMKKKNQIPGVIWKLNSFSQLQDLQRYETAHYCPCDCEPVLSRGSGGGGAATLDGPCLTFVWAGDPASSDLGEGTFDLELYRRTTKKFMMLG